MRRLEFVYHDAGGGHRAAATALESVIKSQQRRWEVKLFHLQTILEPLDILQKYGRIRIQEFYNAMLRNGWTLGSAQLLKILQLVIRTHHRPALRLLEAHWKESQPDIVISVIPHFNRVLCESFAHAFPGRPFVTILTDIADYPPHFWIEPASPAGGQQKQYLICGSDRAVAQARSLGHPDDEVFRASGMILNPKFYDAPAIDRVAERQKIGLRPDLPTGLVLFGGYGSKAMLEIAERIEQSGAELQMIYICGKNEKLAAALRAQKSRLPRFIEGFTTRVNEYMQLADFFVGKPGPGSVSEALAMRLPVIVECNAWTLPQERYNAEWIVEKQVGIVLPNFHKVDEAVTKFVESSALARYRANAGAINNRAVFEIPGFLEQILDRSAGAAATSNSNELLAQKTH